MTPTEKAQDLFTKMISIDERFGDVGAYEAKQCALIAVDEILNNFGQLTEGSNFYTGYDAVKFYKEVKQEIEKL